MAKYSVKIINCSDIDLTSNTLANIIGADVKIIRDRISNVPCVFGSTGSFENARIIADTINDTGGSAEVILCGQITTKTDVIQNQEKKHRSHLPLIIISVAVAIFLVVCGFTKILGKKYTDIEKTAIFAVSELRQNLVDRTSLALTDDVQVHLYDGYNKVPENSSIIIDDGTGAFVFLEIPYSAKNRYGARVENSAFYYVKFKKYFSDDPKDKDKFICEYIGDMNDWIWFREHTSEEVSIKYSDIFIRFCICSLFGFNISDTVSAEMLAKECGCDIIS